MSSKLRIRRPSAMTTVLLAALVLAVSGFAAVATTKDEVTLRTLTGGPVHTGAPGEAVQIPLTPSANTSFVQKAGEALLLILDAHTSNNLVDDCNVTVVVRTATDEDGAIFVQDQANKGQIGLHTEHELLPAPASNTARTIEAFAEEDFENPNPVCDVSDEDTWTVSVNVSVVTLRN